MELVASAKLRRAQDAIESLRPYAQAMRKLMAQAARQSGGAKGLVLLEERDPEGTAIVVAITGDRGLAGAFNVNIVRTAVAVADRLLEEGFSEVVFTTVGKKGAGTLKFRRLPGTAQDHDGRPIAREFRHGVPGRPVQPANIYCRNSVLRTQQSPYRFDTERGNHEQLKYGNVSAVAYP